MEIKDLTQLLKIAIKENNITELKKISDTIIIS